jgi:predicted aspartyl protease
MKSLLEISKHSVCRSVFLTIFGLLITIKLLPQDLSIDQTLNYLNNKFLEYPYQDDHYIYYYSLSLTTNSELNFELKMFFKDPFKPGETDLSSIEIFKISPDKTDLNESFLSDQNNEKNYLLYIYPNEYGSFYEEKINDKGVQEYKRTIPFEHGVSINSYFKSKNYICIYLGDAGEKQNFKNALLHLCTLIISDPLKYATSENDPFDNKLKRNKPDILQDTLSNTISFAKTQSGLIEVPITINDVLRIKFIFDSGASEVSISPDVALTLLRTGTISESDWLPSQNYIFADGSKAKSERFLIKKLIIGNQTLTNIEASISRSIEAPMLIGQNVIQKLGAVTIDYDNHLLIIKKKQK